MFGSIVRVPSAGAQGMITGDSGADYSFTAASWRDQDAAPAPGMRVTFDARGSHAVDVRPAQGATQPGTSKASSASPPSSPQPAVQQQPKRSQGSIWSAIRSMSMVFVLTPVSIPLIGLLPFIGRLELLVMLLVPGFLGGRRAGSVKKAMAAASIVGAVYGLLLFLLVLAVLHFLVGLPLVGSHVEAGLNAIGGLVISSTFVALIATFPFVLSLMIGGFVGAITKRS